MTFFFVIVAYEHGAKLVVSISYMDIGWNWEDSLASPVSRIYLLCLRKVIAEYLLVVTWGVGLD